MTFIPDISVEFLAVKVQYLEIVNLWGGSGRLRAASRRNRGAWGFAKSALKKSAEVNFGE